jgi:hypothetical protein
MVNECPKGHPTPTAAHRDKQGYCRECRRIGSKEVRRREREAVQIVRELEKITPDELLAHVALAMLGERGQQ